MFSWLLLFSLSLPPPPDGALYSPCKENATLNSHPLLQELILSSFLSLASIDLNRYVSIDPLSQFSSFRFVFLSSPPPPSNLCSDWGFGFLPFFLFWSEFSLIRLFHDIWTIESDYESLTVFGMRLINIFYGWRLLLNFFCMTSTTDLLPSPQSPIILKLTQDNF